MGLMVETNTQLTNLFHFTLLSLIPKVGDNFFYVTLPRENCSSTTYSCC